MTRRQLIAGLLDFDHANEGEWEKEVIVVLKGAKPPFPDVTGLGKPNEDTVIIKAETFQ